MDLPVLTSSNQVLSTWKTLATLFKAAYINEEVNGTEPFASISVSCLICSLFSSEKWKDPGGSDLLLGQRESDDRHGAEPY